MACKKVGWVLMASGASGLALTLGPGVAAWLAAWLVAAVEELYAILASAQFWGEHGWEVVAVVSAVLAFVGLLVWGAGRFLEEVDAQDAALKERYPASRDTRYGDVYFD